MRTETLCLQAPKKNKNQKEPKWDDVGLERSVPVQTTFWHELVKVSAVVTEGKR